MIRSLLRMTSRVSVRTRIVLLALIPVVGFLVNGIAFTAGEAEVEQAFNTAERASDLAETSREFRTAVISLRVRTRDFVGQPSQDLIRSFQAAHEAAVRTLSAIDAAVDASTRRKLTP